MVFQYVETIKDLQNKALDSFRMVNGIPIPRNKDYDVIVLESWSLFNDTSYNTFIRFLEENEDYDYYILPYEILGFEKDYIGWIKDPDNKNKDWLHCFNVNTVVPFSSFAKLQEDYLFWSRSLILFNEDRKWLIFNNWSWDLMFIWFDPAIKPPIDSVYQNHEDKVYELNHMLDFMEFAPEITDKALCPNLVKHVFKTYYPGYDRKLSN